MTFYWHSLFPLLHKPLLFQEVGGHFFGIQPLDGNAGIQLLQRFFIQLFEDRFEPFCNVRYAFSTTSRTTGVGA